MINRIKTILGKLGVNEYMITETSKKSAELFFIKKSLDMKRVNDNLQYELIVYNSFEKDGQKYKGHAISHIFPGMSDKEIEEKIRTTRLASSFVYNKTYELPNPTDNGFIEMDSDIMKAGLEDSAKIMADALFAEDNRKDAFINSAELFVYDDTVRIVTSKGIDAGYRKCRVWGEFVTQCKAPKDVETYKDFEYNELDTEALKTKVRRTLDYTMARAQAETAPATGSYRVILSNEYVATLFDYYMDKAGAGDIYAGYSSYTIGRDVQVTEGHENVTGDRVTLTLRASKPFTEEGIRMKDRVMLDKGVLKEITGLVRFSSYLGRESIGVYDSIRVEPGKVSVEEMKKQPYLEIVNFSDFQMDSFTGHFGGEIRLGFLHDGEKVIPVTGGSVNGSWLEAQGKLVLSSDMQKEKGFEGPAAVCIDDVAVAGV